MGVVAGSCSQLTVASAKVLSMAPAACAALAWRGILLVTGQFGATVASPRMEVEVNQSVSQPLLAVVSVGSARASLLLAMW